MIKLTFNTFNTFLLSVLFVQMAGATTYRISHTENDEHWVFGTALVNNKLNATEKEEFDATTFQFSIGKGTTKDNWGLYTTFDIISGPYKPLFGETLEMEVEGIGLSTVWHYGLGTEQLRKQNPAVSLTLGASIFKIIARSIGTNNSLAEDYDTVENDQKIAGYKLDVTSLNILFGITTTWMDAARPLGNDPSLLKTIVEGVSGSLLIEYPIVPRYSASKTELSYDPASERISEITNESSGRSGGWSLMLRLTTYFSS